VSDIVLMPGCVRCPAQDDDDNAHAPSSLESACRHRSAARWPIPQGGRILLVDDRPSSYERLAPELSAEHTANVEINPAEALFHAAEATNDLLIVSLASIISIGLRLCSQARSLERPARADPRHRRCRKTMRGCSRSGDRVNDYCCGRSQERLLARRAPRSQTALTDHLRDTCRIPSRCDHRRADGLHNRRYMKAIWERWPSSRDPRQGRWR